MTHLLHLHYVGHWLHLHLEALSLTHGESHTHTKNLYTRGFSVSVGAGEGLLCSSSALIPVENLQQKSEREI